MRNIETFNNQYYPINFKGINEDFCNDFISFLFNDEGLSQNSVWTRIKIIRTFLNAANKKNIIEKSMYVNLKVKPFEPQLTYLTKNNLQQIIDADLSESKRLDKIRDRGLVSCYTAMRFSDVSKLDASKHIQVLTKDGKEIEVIRFMQGKQKRGVLIPLHPDVKAILNKHGGQLPKIGVQQANKNVRLFCKEAGIDEVVTIIRDVKGVPTEFTMPKWQAMNTRACRATAATNLYKEGVPIESIMRFGDWKTMKVFMRYVRLAEIEHTSIVANSDFFK